MPNDFAVTCLKTVYKRKALVLSVAALAFVVAVGREWGKGSQYTAETTLVVTSVPPQPDKTVIGPQLPEALSPKVYQSLALSTDVVGGLLNELGGDKTVFPKGAPELREFTNAVSASIITVDPTTRPVNYAPLLVLSATADTAVAAKAIVRQWTDLTMRASHVVNNVRISAARDALREQEGSHRTRLDEIWVKQSEETAKYNVDLLKVEMEKRQELIVDQEKLLLAAQADWNGAQEQLAAAQEKLKTEPTKSEFFKSPDDVAWWMAGAGQKPELKKEGMVTQESNPSFVLLTNDINKSIQQVASSKARVEQLKKGIDDLHKKQEDAQLLYSQHKLIQTRLQTEEEYMHKTYENLAQMGVFLDAGSSVTAGKPASGVEPVGLNRIGDEVYVRSYSGLLGGKGRVLATTVLGGFLAILYVLARPVLGPYLEQLKPR
jgi:hypothetical protein